MCTTFITHVRNCAMRATPMRQILVDIIYETQHNKIIQELSYLIKSHYML